jgi:hypothetical protein
MRSSVLRHRSSVLSVKSLVVLGSVLLVATVAIGVALAATSTKNFTASIVAGPGAQEYTFTLTNHQSSNQSLGSANVLVPDEVDLTTLSVAAPTVSGGKIWTSFVNGSVIELRAKDARNAIARGESVSIVITATTACTVQTTWSTFAKQSNTFLGTGNDFVLLGDQPSVTLSGTGVATLEIGTIDDPQEKDTEFSATVTATDACGNPGTGSVSIELLPGSNTGQLTGTSPLTLDSNGQATFDDLSIDKSGTDYRLKASWNGVTDESNEFDVVDEICRSGSPCFASDGLGTSVSAPSPPFGATLAITFSGLGSTSSCGTHDIVGSRITLDPVGYQAASEVTMTWPTAQPPGVGVPFYVICLDDGKPGSPKVLPVCAKQDPQATCELRRSRTGVGDFQAVVLLAPFDPGFDFG